MTERVDEKPEQIGIDGFWYILTDRWYRKPQMKGHSGPTTKEVGR